MWEILCRSLGRSLSPSSCGGACDRGGDGDACSPSPEEHGPRRTPPCDLREEERWRDVNDTDEEQAERWRNTVKEGRIESWRANTNR